MDNWNPYNTTTFVNPMLNQAPVTQWSMVATLNQATLDVIRQIVREELQRQEGFIRCVVQEELEAYHDKGLDNLMADISEPVDEQEEIAAVLATMTAEEWETLVQRVKARKAGE